MLKNQDLCSLLIAEQQQHPLAQLRDYYKLVFQAIYGPGHLIEDENSAYLYLEQELKNSMQFDSAAVQYLSWQILFNDDDSSIHPQDYCRVSLKTIVDNQTSIKLYFNAFIDSSKDAVAYKTGQWLSIWKKTEQFLKNMKIVIDLNEAEKLQQYILEENPIVRHSETYRQEYHPHYRLIRKRYLQGLLGI